MTDQNLAIVVLAAGQGTRMKSATPKLLHPLGGMPIVGHVLATAHELGAAHVDRRRAARARPPRRGHRGRHAGEP